MKVGISMGQVLASWLLVGCAAALAQVAEVDGQPGAAGGDLLLDPVHPGQHWIGVGLGQVSPTLRAQLNLNESEGIVIHRVVAGSPAEQAGLQEHDVIINVNGKSVEAGAELANAVANSGGKVLEVTYFRGGKLETVEVTPSAAERPAAEAFGPGGDVPGLPPSFRQFFQERRPQGGPFGLRRIAPPMVFGGPRRELPADVSVSVHRQGDAPAEITVKRGDEVWELTEDQLDQLPEDLRPHVLGMTGAQGGPFRMEIDKALEGLQVPELDVLTEEGRLRFAPEGGIRGFTPPDDAGRGIRQRLERLEEELRGLRERLLPPESEPEPEGGERT